MSRGRSLGSGGYSPTGSFVNVIVVILIVVVLILCGGVFLLYNQEKGASNDAVAAKQALSNMNKSYQDLADRYATQISNNTDLGERYDQLDVQFKNASANYESLKNQSDTTTVKLGEFMESDPTVAYNYNITAEGNSSNVSAIKLNVNVYNVGKTDVSNVNVKVTIRSIVDNSTGEIVKQIPTIPSLSKHSVDVDLDNTTRVQSVWVGIGSS